MTKGKRKRRTGDGSSRAGPTGVTSAKPGASGKPAGGAPSSSSAPRTGPAGSPAGSGAARGTALPRRTTGKGSANSPRQRTVLPEPAPTPPRFLVSLARGATVAGSSLALLVLAFVMLLLLWLTYSVSGVVRVASPGVMAQLEALAPLHSLLDVQFYIVANRVFTSLVSLALVVLLLFLRTTLTTLSIALIVERFAEPRPWREELRAAFARALATFRTVLAIEAMFLMLVFLVPTVLGAILGQLGAILALIAGMFFLVYAPVVAVTEGLGLAATVRTAIRAARLPGPWHLLFVFGYLSLAIFLITASSTSAAAATATPSLLVWAYAMFTTFLHLGVLAAFVYRWLAVRTGVFALMSTPKVKSTKERRLPMLRP